MTTKPIQIFFVIIKFQSRANHSGAYDHHSHYQHCSTAKETDRHDTSFSLLFQHNERNGVGNDSDRNVLQKMLSQIQ